MPAIVATGSAMPEQIRTNDDPIFAWLREHEPPGQNLFYGYNQRRVLGPGESVTSIMVEAARTALVSAGLEPSEIDMLLGYGSVGEYVTPNTLAQVHAELGLPASTEVLPLNNDMTNWGSAVVIADALINVRRIERALIVCGSNWTQYVDYHTPQAISAGDGAGASILAPVTSPSQWRLVDREQLTASQDYGAMFMAADPLPTGGFGPTYMHLTPAGLEDYVVFGEKAAWVPVQTLLARNGLTPSQVTLICHQASMALISQWQSDLPGITILDTLATYANLVTATVPVNLDQLGAKIQTDHLVTLSLGVQLHAGALLFARGVPATD
ncbi:MAG TPA: 3-oxoacyl-[acyl-carrier-protein] synthase III C-terminal domain-containing protein [Solirubrobacteraceae bacterium]|jgi:3-oxoacyl-[acyl-carrier-protein] synthase-3|nr:3-oxoacyl-[acyl-carrier-protein] synthase III C-terminal domain-containing protein [Solirubrobacteraceae bacterium]